MEKPHIWVDADSCPSNAKNIILKAAVKNELYVTYAANRNIPFSISSPLFNMVICPKEEGAADDYIVTNAGENDIVITRDIPLASRLVKKEIVVINDRGTLFDSKNTQEMLKQRELNMMMNAIGVHTGGRWDSYGKKETYDFAVCFDRILQSKIAKYKASQAKSF